MTTLPIGYDEACAIIADRIVPLKPEERLLADAADHVAATDLSARVDSPSADASLRDGFAVRAADVDSASPESAIRLTVAGDSAAGADTVSAVTAGTAVRVRTGGRIPEGADAVVASEFTRDDGDEAAVFMDTTPGRHILVRGSDVQQGAPVVIAGQRLSPGRIGLLAAAGCNRVAVIPRPTVGILATGDELVAPGEALGDGQLFASNQATLDAWCRSFGMNTRLELAGDDPAAIADCLTRMVGAVDAVLTSGGAWKSDRDHMGRVLDGLGWERLFHRIRLGPGKAVGAGLLGEKPVFILPGGPPSNLAAFLLVALPGLLRMAGCSHAPFATRTVPLGADIYGQADWTQVVYGTFTKTDKETVFDPTKRKSRLHGMAEADALVLNPEGCERLEAGVPVTAHLLHANRMIRL